MRGGEPGNLGSVQCFVSCFLFFFFLVRDRGTVLGLGEDCSRTSSPFRVILGISQQ